MTRRHEDSDAGRAAGQVEREAGEAGDAVRGAGGEGDGLRPRAVRLLHVASAPRARAERGLRRGATLKSPLDAADELPGGVREHPASPGAAGQSAGRAGGRRG